MSNKETYPKYATYEGTGKHPSMLDQKFPRPTLRDDEHYYPDNPILAPYFTSEEEVRRFGAANICGFLDDTIEVEHCLVIPAIASLRRLPYDIPPQPKKDLYKTATDEGHHAEQSLHFLLDVRAYFNLKNPEPCRAPLFLRRLELEKSLEENPTYRNLITVLNGIVTETRISKELSRFATNEYLAEPVRELCRTHAEDEAIHSSQFRALGYWLWEAFDEPTKVAAARFLTASTIARSLPDIDSIADMLHQSTNRSLIDCRRLVYSAYTEDILIGEMIIAAQPTINFLRQLGAEEYLPFVVALERERERLGEELEKRRKDIK